MAVHDRLSSGSLLSPSSARRHLIHDGKALCGLETVKQTERDFEAWTIVLALPSARAQAGADAGHRSAHG